MKSLREKAIEIRDAGIAVRHMELLLDRDSITHQDKRTIEKYYLVLPQD